MTKMFIVEKDFGLLNMEISQESAPKMQNYPIVTLLWLDFEFSANSINKNAIYGTASRLLC